MQEIPYQVFDFHNHLYPDSLAPKCVPYLAQRFGNAPAFDGTVAGVKKDMETSGVHAVLNLPVATKPSQVVSINNWAHENDSFPVYSLATIHPDLPDLAGELQRIRDLGFRGIKLHAEYQLFTLDDPRMNIVWEKCREFGLLVMLHAGGERVFEPPYHTSPTSIAAFIDRWPGLTVAAAHLGGFGMWDESERVLIGKDIWLDLSHTFNWMPDEQIVRMARKHGIDRILWGTDAPWQKPSEILKRFLEQPFTDAERRKILWTNAHKLLGIAENDKAV
jgi:predicted TIM-barrel fold metal-dependent hydrolase